MMHEERSKTRVVIETFSLTMRLLFDLVLSITWWGPEDRDRSSGRDRDRTGIEIIVLSQVPWDYLWQRNHHTMAIISRQAKVLYCCPIPTVTAAKERKSRDALAAKHFNENLMHFRPLVLWGDSRSSLVRALNRLILSAAVRRHASSNGMGGKRRVLWFYYPTFGTLAGHLDEDFVVYDIQDEYSAFSWFPRDTVQREQSLLTRCDLVFTGTLQLWKRKKQYNPNMFFVQCGVESDHFRKALNGDTEIPHDMAGIAKPVFGYFGLVDARVDMGMLEAVASRRPDWTFVLIGPCHVEKRSPNILLTGRREYNELPAYLKAFDICMIPFVMNANTKNLNPTKLLEYFASGRPVISAPIPDVVDLYSHLVEIAATPEEFIAAADRLLTENGRGRSEEMQKEAAENSWEGMVNTMLTHIERTFEEQ
jgi:glycosyltransferase involved in cell wall biosynthesis